MSIVKKILMSFSPKFFDNFSRESSRFFFHFPSLQLSKKQKTEIEASVISIFISISAHFC